MRPPLRLLTSALLLGLLALPAAADPAVPEERPLIPMPRPLTSFGAALCRGYLYTCGGHDGGAHDYSRDTQVGEMYRLNLADGSWEILPKGARMQSIALVEYKGALIRVGGLAALNAQGEEAQLRSSVEVQRYDPLTDRWTALPDLPEPRSSHDAEVLDGKLYVFGGWSLSSEGRSWCDGGCVLDLEDPEASWQPLPQAFVRRGLDLSAHQGRIVAIGGLTKTGDISSRVDIFDPATGDWSRGADLPGQGFGTSAVSFGARLFATDMSGRLYASEDPATSWSQVSSLNFPRFFHRLLALPSGELAAVGGGGHLGRARSVELLRPDTKGPTITAISIPNPGLAKARQTIFQSRAQLLVFGGNTSTEQHQFGPENFLDEGFAIDLAGLTSRALAPQPERRQSLRSVEAMLGERYAGIAIGGFGHDGEKARSHSDVFSYDIEADRWTRSEVTLPKPLTQFGCIALGDRLYVLGGLDYDPDRKDDFSHSEAIFAWDLKSPEAGFWQAPYSLQTPRRAFGCALLGDRIAVVGGFTDDFTPVTTCELIDPKAGTITTFPAPTPRAAPQMVSLGGRLYIAGGLSPTEDGNFAPNRSLEVYDPASRSWHTLIASLPMPGRELRLMTLDQRLLLYSAQHTEPKVEILLIDPNLGPVGPAASRPAKD